MIACLQHSDIDVIFHHLNLSADHDVKAVALIALVEDGGSGAEALLAQLVAELDALGVGQAREERYAAQPATTATTSTTATTIMRRQSEMHLMRCMLAAHRKQRQ